MNCVMGDNVYVQTSTKVCQKSRRDDILVARDQQSAVPGSYTSTTGAL